MRRKLAEHLLAEERVEVDAPQPALLEGLARHLARLVVGDDQLAVVVELEAVDDAAERERADVRLELELEPDGPHAGGVLELEVAAHELLGVGEEGHLVVGLEREVGEVGMVAQLLAARPSPASATSSERCSGRLAEQQLEGTVHERALGGPRRGRLGQPIDGGELEREPTVLERRHLRRRERAGKRKDHRLRRYSGGVTAQRTRSGANQTAVQVKRLFRRGRRPSAPTRPPRRGPRGDRSGRGRAEPPCDRGGGRRPAGPRVGA